jgi:hypothetical protein
LAGPGGAAGPGGFAGPGAGPTGSTQGWNGTPDWNAGPGWNGVPDWQGTAMPAGGPGPSGYPGYGYPGADGYGESVNGGDYAYVINEDGAGSARPGRPRGPQRRLADEPRPRTDGRGQAPTDGLRAISAGAAARTWAADPSADASGAYGRDDPGYGPPGSSWYNKGQSVAEPAEETAGSAQPAAIRPIDPDSRVSRGPFEPRGEADAPVSSEFPGIADDDPAGSADAALGRLKELHLTAAAIAPQSLDAHFDQVLERQRKLISEYLSEAVGPTAER